MKTASWAECTPNPAYTEPRNFSLTQRNPIEYKHPAQGSEHEEKLKKRTGKQTRNLPKRVRAENPRGLHRPSPAQNSAEIQGDEFYQTCITSKFKFLRLISLTPSFPTLIWSLLTPDLESLTPPPHAYSERASWPSTRPASGPLGSLRRFPGNVIAPPLTYLHLKPRWPAAASQGHRKSSL